MSEWGGRAGGLRAAAVLTLCHLYRSVLAVRSASSWKRILGGTVVLGGVIIKKNN